MIFEKTRARWRAIPNGDKNALFYFVILPLVVFVLWLVGYIMNIMTLWNMSIASGEGIARLAGVFLFPLGGIIGWF